MWSRTRCAILFLILPAALAAQNTAAPKQQKPPDCSAAEHHSFDFWIGEWEVYTPKGDLAGHSRIEPLLEGCALLENWTSTKFGAGKSLNYFDRRTREWKQYWIDSSGRAQNYTGSPKDGGMLFLDREEQPGKPAIIRRMQFTPRGKDEVRQFIEQSTDGGKTFSVWFDGIYKRKR